MEYRMGENMKGSTPIFMMESQASTAAFSSIEAAGEMRGTFSIYRLHHPPRVGIFRILFLTLLLGW